MSTGKTNFVILGLIGKNIRTLMSTTTSGVIPQEHGPLLICFSKKEKVVCFLCVYRGFATFVGGGGGGAATVCTEARGVGSGLPLSFSS